MNKKEIKDKGWYEGKSQVSFGTIKKLSLIEWLAYDKRYLMFLCIYLGICFRILSYFNII